MLRWYDQLSDQRVRTDLGNRLEAVADTTFNVLRWAVVVGFARFLTDQAPSFWSHVIHWSTSALLFGYLASIFLLRPEVRLFRHLDQIWKRRLQTAANLVVCMIAYLLVMRGIDFLVEGIARFRFAPVP